jgi:hypothetical protein
LADGARATAYDFPLRSAVLLGEFEEKIGGESAEVSPDLLIEPPGASEDCSPKSATLTQRSSEKQLLFYPETFIQAAKALSDAASAKYSFESRIHHSNYDCRSKISAARK